MRYRKRIQSRNRLDLGDQLQVKVLSRRLRLSPPELNEIVGRIGNSIAAISKEAAQRRAKVLQMPADVPSAAVIAQTESVTESATPADISSSN